jgi:hypothetical protein
LRKAKVKARAKKKGFFERWFGDSENAPEKARE